MNIAERLRSEKEDDLCTGEEDESEKVIHCV